MINVYRGIDIAGDQSKTGLADILDFGDKVLARIHESGFGEDCGLKQLTAVKQSERLACVAIDQPLGFPAPTARLLVPHCPADTRPLVYFAHHFRYRRADSAMRAVLKYDGLNLDYVLPPVVCDNVWRALFLLHRAGQNLEEVRLGNATWFETHPRLCVATLVPRNELSLVEKYKAKGPKARIKEERQAMKLMHTLKQQAARSRCIELLCEKFPRLFIDQKNRQRALDDDNAFEALFCAMAAYAKGHQRVKRFPESDLPLPDAVLEGYVFIPDWAAFGS